MSGKENNDILSFIITDMIPALPPMRPSFQPRFCDLISPTNDYGVPSSIISDLDASLIPPSMVLSSDSTTHFQTTTKLRDNSLDQNSSDLTTYAFLNCNMQGPNQRGLQTTPEDECESRDMRIRHSDDDQMRNVHMFSNAQDILIRDTAIHNAGRDIMIINNYICAQLEPSSSNSFSQMMNPRIVCPDFILPNGFLVSHEINQESVTEEALNNPPLNAQVLRTETSMCIPGVVSRTVSSTRYSFF